MQPTKFHKGDLVRFKTNTALDALIKKVDFSFIGTVLECRHKTNAYYVCPWNSPFTVDPYWISGHQLEAVKE